VPIFHVRCKNPDCRAILPTPYYTDPIEEIKAAMAAHKPIEITCRICSQLAGSTQQDLVMVPTGVPRRR
jgi:hypothetical protein